MTLAAPWLLWIGGAFAGLAVAGFARHKGLGILLLVIAAILTFWAWSGNTLTVHAPQVGHSPGVSSTK